jgi:hypothetical protein
VISFSTYHFLHPFHYCYRFRRVGVSLHRSAHSPYRHKRRPNIFACSFPPSPAWQSQDIAPSNTGISIPAHDVNGGAPMATDDQSWNNNSGRSPGRDRDAPPPRRSSRSRSPGAARDSERGLVFHFIICSVWAVHAVVWDIIHHSRQPQSRKQPSRFGAQP